MFLLFHNHPQTFVLIFGGSLACLAWQLIKEQGIIGPLQFMITWYKNRHAGEQTTHWDIQVALFWMSQWAVCSPAWWLSYHVIVNCKGPIYMHII